MAGTKEVIAAFLKQDTPRVKNSSGSMRADWKTLYSYTDFILGHWFTGNEKFGPVLFVNEDSTPMSNTTKKQHTLLLRACDEAHVRMIRVRIFPKCVGQNRSENILGMDGNDVWFNVESWLVCEAKEDRGPRFIETMSKNRLAFMELFDIDLGGHKHE